MRTFWTEKEIKFLTDNYSNMKTADLAVIMNRPLGGVNGKAYDLGLKKSKDYMVKLLAIESQKLLNSGKKHQFKKGQLPHNKGQKMSKEMYEKCKKTFFTKGHKPANTKLKGDERIHEGYTYVKIEDRDWRLKHRLIYENAFGPIPADSIVIFKDNNFTNFDINNLEVITKAENMLRNTIHQYPEPIKQIIKLNNKLKKQINAKQN
jgi:hypothetical protein